MKLLTKGGVRYISRSTRRFFVVCSGLHAIWVEVTGHDNSAADIMIHNSYIHLLMHSSYIICTGTGVFIHICIYSTVADMYICTTTRY